MTCGRSQVRVLYCAPMEENLKPTVIIYHADCPDGFGAAYAAWKKFGDEASYIPWKEHDKLPAGLQDKTAIYIVDFSFRAPLLKELNDSNELVVVIDHHVSAEADTRSYPQNIYDVNHSGAVLAWQYFHPGTAVPELLLQVEDHDLWRFQQPENREFNTSLHQYPMTFESWDELIDNLTNDNFRINFIAKGSLLAKFEDKLVANVLKNKERVRFLGYNVWAINESLYRSVLGNQLAILNEQNGEIAIGITYYRRDGQVSVSLRSNGDVDVASMAQKYGGGGHKNAAAFRVDSFRDLPFEFLD